MANSMCTRRLTRELQSLEKSPLENPRIVALPNESNILEWHYVVEGTGVYDGGTYHGKLIFPKDYPLKPPSVIMMTPSGRFKPNRRLCLSMSDFHPESWNPMWSVSTILTGLYSFMMETAPTFGSIDTTDSEKRKLARLSLDFNIRDKNFCNIFPEYVELHKKLLEERRMQLGSEASNKLSAQVTSTGQRCVGLDGQEEAQGVFAAAAGVVALLSILFAMRFIT